MAERKLIVFLGEEGRRGTQITHGFHDPRELEAIKARGPVVASETESIATPSGPSVLERISALETKVEELTQQLSKLREVT
jgi:electron transfer flavoprotein alpha/beta subunit